MARSPLLPVRDPSRLFSIFAAGSHSRPMSGHRKSLETRVGPQEVTREPCRAPASLRPLPLPFSGLRPGSFPGPVFSSRLLSLALCDLLFSVSENSFILFSDFVSLFPRLPSFSISPPSDVSGFADVRATVFPACRFRARCARETLLRRRALARQGVPAPPSWLSALAADPSSGSSPPSCLPPPPLPPAAPRVTSRASGRGRVP